MKVTPFIIQSFAALILSGSLFKHLKTLVSIQEPMDKSGKEKRDATIAELRAMGVELADWLLKLGIALALAWAESNKGTAQ